jgi:NADH-quinone oxidoreductase subunit L
MTMLQHAVLVLLLPLVSAAVIALFFRRAHGVAALVSTLTAAAIAVIAIILAVHGERFESATEWLKLGNFSVSLGVKFDDLAALMLCIVGVVGLCVHVFSLGYMKDDGAKARYFGGLSIFMFSMIGIVLADNLLMIFIFWELVGFSSWLLINHFHAKQSAADASKKAFIVNRVGDFGFLLGIVMCYWANGTVSFTALGSGQVFSTAIALLLFCGAVGKSAQLPLQVWLPDAMEGPTPVSALIHAATMVAAGIFMLCRIEPLMPTQALNIIMWTGAATALYAALCAITQRDIKKVLAYSTLSQLGYMVAAFGLGSIAVPNAASSLRVFSGSSEPDLAHSTLMAVGVGAAMFHLTTHAFFKALMFLGSGSVIHGCHHEQDIFKMGGLAKKMPLTFFTFTIGVLAIIGMPGLAGFFSKDAILHLALEKSHAVFGVLALTAVLTSFYMVRMWKLVFLGTPRSDDASHAHEGGLTLTAPLVLLAVLSVAGGYTVIYGGKFDGVLKLVPHAEGHTILIVSLAVMVVGAGSALWLYKSSSTDSLAQKAPLTFLGLHLLKESFDRAYDWLVAKVQQRFAMLLRFLEDVLLAGVIVRGLAGVVGLFGLGARALLVGNLHAYVWWFLGGTAVLWAFAAGWLG